MSDAVEIEQIGSVLTVGFKSPPVNALSLALRQGIGEAIERARGASDIGAILLYGTGRMFCAGADISEFSRGAHLIEPKLKDLIVALAGLGKPSVAAIHGAALGGGLELALGCSVRVAFDGAKLGLPEINLGIIPGAGGTQRLPRLIEAGEAARMIVTGKPVPAGRAHDLGLVRAVLAGEDVRAAALDWLGGQGLETLGLPLQPDAAPARETDLQSAIGKELARARKTVGPSAPAGALAALEVASRLPLGDGLTREREIFESLVVSNESASLRHAFFAERQAGKLGGAPDPRPVATVAILGGGTMGTGIALACLNAGLQVTLREVDAEAAGRARKRIADQLDADLARGRIDREGHAARTGRLTTTAALEDIAGADLLVEAVFEDMDLKMSVLEAASRTVGPDCVIATNTSYLDVDRMGDAVANPERFVGMHFFSPAWIMKLVEVIRAKRASPETLSTALAFARKIGKIPVLAGVCHGFIGNRMWERYQKEAAYLVEEGATPEQVDKALTGFGFAMGPFAVADLAGLDVDWRMRQSRPRAEGEHYPRAADRLCELGRYGQKTGAGWYRYEPGSRTPVPDPEAVEIAHALAREDGIAQRVVSDEEIVERAVLQLVNAGAELLGEGIAERASDVDAVWLHGYGFPRWRGGPLFYGARRGWRDIAKRLEAYAAKSGERWMPAPAILAAARDGVDLDEAVGETV